MLYLYGSIVVLFCVLMGIQPDDSSSGFVYFVAAILASSLFLKHIPQSLLACMGLIATACMLVCFGEFFLFVHAHEVVWYAAAEPGGAWCCLVAGFAMVQVIAAYSCRFKENACFDSPNDWFQSLPRIRRRIEGSRTSS